MQEMHHEHHNKQMSKGIKSYMPLIVVILAILLAVYITHLYTGDFTIRDSMRYFMGYFFLLFGFFKVLDWKGFVGAYAEYDVITKVFKPYGYVYPIIELTLGTLYLTNLYPLYVNWATVIIMGISSIGVIQAVTNKRQIRCACLGVVVKLPMTTVTIIEDIGMGLMALGMIFWI